jgi:hypothetical protein
MFLAVCAGLAVFAPALQAQQTASQPCSVPGTGVQERPGLIWTLGG